jgi:hypothetical protein
MIVVNSSVTRYLSEVQSIFPLGLTIIERLAYFSGISISAIPTAF